MESHFQQACRMADEFTREEGRRPRILLARVEGGDCQWLAIPAALADVGFDVDIGPPPGSARELARQAVENDVHLLGLFSCAGRHRTLLPGVVAELKKLGRSDILVMAGGAIPAEDFPFLYRAGVAGVFRPDTPMSLAAQTMLRALLLTGDEVTLRDTVLSD